jgi:multicomponent Na+:H+ antiporter subunit B
MEDTSVPNIVTAVLADYRGYDTMFETIVIFCAGIASIFLLRTRKHKAPETRLYRSTEFERVDLQWVPYDLIIKTACRVLIPFFQLFALYVIAHGHHSPGGGFQGGVILGATLILYAISHDLRTTIKRMSEKAVVFLSAAGVLLLGVNYLDYSGLAAILGVDPVSARSHGILIVEIGVGIAVMAVMVSLYYNLSSVGKQDEGL